MCLSVSLFVDNDDDECWTLNGNNYADGDDLMMMMMVVNCTVNVKPPPLEGDSNARVLLEQGK